MTSITMIIRAASLRNSRYSSRYLLCRVRAMQDAASRRNPVIDKEPRAQKTLELVLPDPYILVSAYSARHGMKAAERDGPDVVLLDINLPERDGIALLHEIQARPCLPPIVMPRNV